MSYLALKEDDMSGIAEIEAMDKIEKTKPIKWERRKRKGEFEEDPVVDVTVEKPIPNGPDWIRVMTRQMKTLWFTIEEAVIFETALGKILREHDDKTFKVSEGG